MNAPLLIKKSTSVTADFCVMTFTTWSMDVPVCWPRGPFRTLTFLKASMLFEKNNMFQTHVSSFPTSAHGIRCPKALFLRDQGC